MKFTILPRYQKIGLFVLMIIAIVGLVGIGLLINYTNHSIAEVWNELHIIIKIFMCFLCVMLLFGVYSTIFLVFTHVEINETGIELHMGKLILNKMQWKEIKWVETFCEANIYVPRQHIAVSKSNKWEYKEVRNYLLQNFSRKKITFLFDAKAIDLIKQHCDCFIYGQNLIEESK